MQFGTFPKIHPFWCPHLSLSEDTSHIWVKEEELAGVPRDLVSTLERSASGELKVHTSKIWKKKSIHLNQVTCQYPHYQPVIKMCSVPETRFKIEKAFQSRCVDHNTKIIEVRKPNGHPHSTFRMYIDLMCCRIWSS